MHLVTNSIFLLKFMTCILCYNYVSLIHTRTQLRIDPIPNYSDYFQFVDFYSEKLNPSPTPNYYNPAFMPPPPPDEEVFFDDVYGSFV